MGSAHESSLHTLDDNGASDYLDETLGDGDPLIPPEDIPPGPYPDEYLRVPRQADYDVLPNPRTPYYIQQSYEVHESGIYEESQGFFSLSPVRRMFCLLSLFDCLLTFLMWVIYLQLRPGGIAGNLTPEVKHLKVQTSLFDIVICSFGRTFLLLLFYSFIIKSKKWYVVALTTSVSTIYLLMKVFLLESEAYKNGQPINFFLIIFSFVICWCEAWHFDFKVVPTEIKMKKGKLSNTVTPTIGPSNNRRRGPGAPSSAFFTPYARSVYQEEDETGSNISNMSRELDAATEQDCELIRSANDNVHMVFRMLYINDGWSFNRRETDGITVQCRNFEGVGKVYKLEAVLNVHSSVLVRLFWEDVNDQPLWNASVKESKIIRRINNRTDILYSVAAEAGGGVISSRDFVSLRRRARKDTITLLCNISLETDLVPVKPTCVRGYNGPGGWILRDLPNEPNKTEFIWLLNTDLKGWLPQKLVDASLASVMVETCRDIRNHVTESPVSI